MYKVYTLTCIAVEQFGSPFAKYVEIYSTVVRWQGDSLAIDTIQGCCM